MTSGLHLTDGDDALVQEIEPATITMPLPTHGIMTRDTLYPFDVWVDPNLHEPLLEAIQGQWVRCQEVAPMPIVRPLPGPCSC